MNLWNEYRKKVDWKKYESYRVKLRLVDIVGGLPKNPDMMEAWINASNKAKTSAEKKRIKEAHEEELKDIEEEEAEKKAIGFARVDGQLVIEGRQVKAMLKEVANIIKDDVPGAKDGKVAALKSKVAERLFVKETYISLGRTEPDEVDEHPISVMTRLGPRTSIKRCEICKDAEIEFTLLRKIKGPVSEKIMLAILDYGQENGLGADRSQGRGRYEVISVEKC